MPAMASDGIHERDVTEDSMRMVASPLRSLLAAYRAHGFDPKGESRRHQGGVASATGGSGRLAVQAATKRRAARLTPVTTDEGLRSMGPARSTSANRSSSSSRTTLPSRRARAAPRQKWFPWPKARWGLGSLPTSKVEALGPKTPSSRFAEAHNMRSGSPSAM